MTEAREGFPPELPADHPLVRLCVDLVGRPAGTAPYGTDASELQAIAPCVVLGPGDIAEAHTPTEKVRVADLAAAVPVFMTAGGTLSEGLIPCRRRQHPIVRRRLAAIGRRQVTRDAVGDRDAVVQRIPVVVVNVW